MLKLNLTRYGEIQILGFKDYQEYKPYKERATANPGMVLYKGEPGKVHGMQKKEWLSWEYQMLGHGSDRWYNYHLGKGHHLLTVEESWQSVLAALEQPAFIIIFRTGKINIQQT